MGAKDVFKGAKWYKPLGKSYHGGGAYEGRGSSPEDAANKSKKRQIASEVSRCKAVMSGCKGCQKRGVCDKHKKESKYIAQHGD